MKGTNPHTTKQNQTQIVRLNKYISNSGVCSRRAADNLISEGRIKVNNNVVKELGTKISVDDKVQLDNKIITSEEKAYLLVNKPRNVICTKSDEKGRKSIMDLLPERFQHLYPVGRLDNLLELVTLGKANTTTNPIPNTTRHVMLLLILLDIVLFN